MTFEHLRDNGIGSCLAGETFTHWGKSGAVFSCSPRPFTAILEYRRN
ncbi:MAG: hypothetical protein ACFCU1_00455 [Sumerlaeia bacterium]